MTVNFTVNGKPAAVDVPPPTAGAKPVSRSSHAKGLRRRACAYLSEVVTQIQLGGSRTDSLVRILHAQPGSPVSANGFGQFPGGEHRKAILAALALLDP